MSESKGLVRMGTEKKKGGDLRLSLSVLIVASVAFALLLHAEDDCYDSHRNQD